MLNGFETRKSVVETNGGKLEIIRKEKGSTSTPAKAVKKSKRTMSPEVRAKLAAAAKARRAKAKDAGKTSV
jgi:hypothetical protein